eukprot:scaffold17121_cov122-Isochrysis_galbana.AAC.1
MYPIRGAVRMSRAGVGLLPPADGRVDTEGGRIGSSQPKAALGAAGGGAAAAGGGAGGEGGAGGGASVAAAEPMYVLYRRDEDSAVKSEVYTPLAASMGSDFSPAVITKLLLGRSDDAPRPPSPADRLKL